MNFTEFIILLFAESLANCKMYSKCLQNDKKLQYFIRIHHSEDILQFASDFAKSSMINSDENLLLVEFIKNLSFLINSALSEINVNFRF